MKFFLEQLLVRSIQQLSGPFYLSRPATSKRHPGKDKSIRMLEGANHDKCLSDMNERAGDNMLKSYTMNGAIAEPTSIGRGSQHQTPKRLTLRQHCRIMLLLHGSVVVVRTHSVDRGDGLSTQAWTIAQSYCGHR